jgi:hypothetical protein
MPSALDWDIAEDASWGPGSTAVLLGVSCWYWIANWVIAGLPPLAALASRLTRPTETNRGGTQYNP